MPYVWIDPPGEHPGWIHACATDQEMTEAIAQHNIPDDNDARRRAYDATREGMQAEQYQAGRDYWGVTVLEMLPPDLPEGIEMVGGKQ